MANTHPEQKAEMFDFTVLRELRKREELTIAEVSKRSGVSAAVISKLERNQVQAELETLFKLSRVYGINTADLLSLAESRTAHKTEAVTYTSSGFRFEKIAYGNVSAYHGSAEAGAYTSRPEIHQDEYEVCWVISGSVEIALPNETHILRPGEALQFDAILEHRYKALEACELILLHLNKGKRF